MEEAFVLTDDPAKAGPANNVIQRAESETKLTMNSALANLPEAQRKVLVLAYFDGLSQSGDCRSVERAVRYVKTRMRSGISV